MIEHITAHNKVFAVIIRSSFQEQGVHFCTPHEYSQQLAYMHHPAGKIIPAHVHNPVHRRVMTTLEVIFIKKGVLRVDIYTDDRAYLESRILSAGDVILLAAGGHGFEVLEDVEMIEVKQGPYAGELDKTRFEGITAHQVLLKEEDGKCHRRVLQQQ